MNGLRDMINEFYENIPEWLSQPIISAINSAEEAHEDHIITPLSQLIINLDRGQNTIAVNNYMTNPVTRGSVTRRFFFPHTLPGNLYPEDREIYAPPPPPPAPLALAPEPAIRLMEFSGSDVVSAHQLRMQAEAYAADLDDDFDDFFGEPPSLPRSIPQPPRIDSFFQPGVAASMAHQDMAHQEPDPHQAQAPGVVPRNIRTLPNDLEEGEIQE